MAYTDTDAYKQAHANYVAAVAVADRTNDTNAKLQAELDFQKADRDLERDYAKVEAQEARLKEVHKEIEEKYPAVPKSVIQHIQDPEALLAAAKEIQEQIGTGDWGGTAGAPSGGGRPKSDKLKEHNDLVDRVNKGDVQANAQFRTKIVQDKILPFIEQQRGNVGARP